MNNKDKETFERLTDGLERLQKLYEWACNNKSISVKELGKLNNCITLIIPFSEVYTDESNKERLKNNIDMIRRQIDEMQ